MGARYPMAVAVVIGRLGGSWNGQPLGFSLLVLCWVMLVEKQTEDGLRSFKSSLGSQAPADIRGADDIKSQAQLGSIRPSEVRKATGFLTLSYLPQAHK